MELWRTLGPFAPASTGAFAGITSEFQLCSSWARMHFKNIIEAVDSIKCIAAESGADIF